MSTGMYPGVGMPLWRSNDSFPREPLWAGMRNPTEVIADDKYSIGFPVNPGIKTIISVIFDSAPTTDAFDIWMSLKGDFSDEYLIDSVAATTDTTYQWVGNVYLVGVIRIQNKGTADIQEAYAQSLASTAV